MKKKSLDDMTLEELWEEIEKEDGIQIDSES